MANKKKSKTASTVTITMPKADSDKLLQQGYDLIQTGKAQDLQKAEECFDQAHAQGNVDALTGLLVLANVYNSKEKLTLGGKELCWDTDAKDNQKAYEILIKIKEALHGEDVLPGGLRLSDEFIQLGGVFEASGETANLRQALECYKIADTLGNAEGAFQYAELTTTRPYLIGFRGELKRIFGGRDTLLEEAYSKAASRGSIKAMRKLARYFRLKANSRPDIPYKNTFDYIVSTIKYFFQHFELYLERIITTLFLLPIDLLLVGLLVEILLNPTAAEASFKVNPTISFIIILFCIFLTTNTLYRTLGSSNQSLLKKSWQWITKAAESGDSISIAQQAYYLFAGIGTQKDQREAINLFEKAAEQNNLNALAFLGNAYEKGLSVIPDEEKAQNYYQRAAAQDITNPENETLSLYWMADAYKRGEFVLQDLEFAEQCFQQSKEMLYWGNTLYGSSLISIQPKRLQLYLTNHQKKEAHRFQENYRRTEQLKTKVITLQTINDTQEKVIAKQLQTITEQFQLNAQKDKLIAEQNQTITAQSQKINTLQDMLTAYQNSLANVRSVWTKTESTIQNSEDFFAAIEELSRIMAESHETEYEKATKALQERFGEYWNRLQPDSQIGLISARTLYELSIQQNATTFDFSGVCISATSALELELKKIFLTDYVKFVKKESFVPDKWPEALRYWSSDSQKWKAKDRFTLGDLPYILESTQAHGSALLNNYLKSILNSNLRKANDPRKPFLIAKGDRPSFLNRIDNLREKYRNPAGHAGAVDKESAKNCCYQIMGSFEAETRLDDTESLLVELLSMLK